MSLEPFAQATALVVADNRKSLLRLIRSRDQFCPSMRMLVAGKRTVDAADLDYVSVAGAQSPFGQLNALLARVTTRFCVVIGGTDQWHRRSNLLRMIEPLQRDRYDLVAGGIVACQRRWVFLARRERVDAFGMFSFAGNQLTLQRAPQTNGIVDCDFASSYFAVRTDKLRAIGGWDGELSLTEQIELYVRAARFDLRIAACQDATIWQWNAASTTAEVIRPLAIERMGISQFVDLAGNCHGDSPRAKAA